jgi:hypothetical protein
MGMSTGGTRRGKGPSACIRIAEIMSGRSYDQQRLAATCKDFLHKEPERRKRL